jgi:chaperone modulatory protein CbpM
MRLQRDLDINLAGVALALDLMDEIESLRAAVSRLESRD